MSHAHTAFKPFHYSGCAEHTSSIRTLQPITNGLGFCVAGAYDGAITTCSALDSSGICQSLKTHTLHTKQVSALLMDVSMKWKHDFCINSRQHAYKILDAVIVSSSQDNLIIGWSHDSGLAFILAFHSENVSSLCRWSKGIVSGSWDRSICVWNETCEIHQVLKGHREAVLCVCVIDIHSEEIVLSGSGDKRILSWNISTGKILREYNHHCDSVRDIVPDQDGTFWSCGNDFLIFKISLEGHILSKLSGHQSFVYQLCKLPSIGLASVSEDRTLRLWADGEIKQVIYHPDTVWSLSVLRDGSIATGCADGCVRIWREFENSNLCRKLAANLAQRVAQCQIAHDVRIPCVEKMYDTELPSRDGLCEGQLVRTCAGSCSFPVYSWSSHFRKWQQVGFQKSAQVLASDTSLQENFVFNIEINGNIVQLAFQSGHDPESVAEEFVRQNKIRYGLNDSHVAEIAAFIIQNTNIEYCEA